MKKLTTYLLITILLVGCEKESINNKYLGVYTNPLETSVTVSEVKSGILKLYWKPKYGATATFDSVLISGSNFTDNENLFLGTPKKSIGTGYFTDNTIYFKFVLNGMDVIEFNGIKN